MRETYEIPRPLRADPYRVAIRAGGYRSARDRADLSTAVHNVGIRAIERNGPSPSNPQFHCLTLIFGQRVCGRSKPWPRSWRRCGHIGRQAPEGSCAICCRAWLPLSPAAFAHGPGKASHFRRHHPSWNLSRGPRRVPRRTKRTSRAIGARRLQQMAALFGFDA